MYIVQELNDSILGVIMYKSIMLSNREHTREVICSAMLKHGLEGSPDDYNLAQMLPDKGKDKFINTTMWQFCNINT